MTNLHIMLDLETWGKRPGCDLRSIGACVFDPLTGFVHDGSLGTIKPFYIATNNPASNPEDNNIVPLSPCGPYSWDGVDAFRKYPLHRDPETVQWWNDQSADAQAAFVVPVDLFDALIRFSDWLSNVTGQLPFNAKGEPDTIRCCLWSHGPAFDVAILAAAYHAVNLPVPWHYRAPRDTRTPFDLANVGDHSAFMQQFNHGTAHHALDDAISQAKAVCGAYARLFDRDPGQI